MEDNESARSRPGEPAAEAAAVIGYRIPMRGFVYLRARSCGHAEAEGCNFCPACGAARGEMEAVVREEHGRFMEWEPKFPLVKYYVRNRPEELAECEGDVAYVGYGARCGAGGPRKLALEFVPADPAELRARVRAALEPWLPFVELRSEDFGLWAAARGE